MPVSDWIAGERERVEKADFAPEVQKMYASAMKLSPRFTREFPRLLERSTPDSIFSGGE